MILITDQKAQSTSYTNPKISEVAEFKVKWSIYQFLSIITLLSISIICGLTIISCFLIQIPEFEVPLTTLYFDPANRLDLNQLPMISYSIDIVAKVKSSNIIPLPISVKAKGALWTNNPEEFYITTRVNNFIIWPFVTNYISARVNILFPLLIHNLNILTIGLETCGMLNSESNERTLLNVNAYIKGYFGYGLISIPMRTVIRQNLTAYCPLVEENFAQIILAYIHKLIPLEEYYNSTFNEKLNNNYNTYLSY